MTFAAYESSVDDGAPVQLFRFVYGTQPGEHFAYTDFTDELVIDHGAPFGEITYEPVPVERGNIVGNGTLDKSALSVRLDIGTGVAELFRVYPPSSVVNLYIYEGHIDDPDGEFQVIWAGRIVSAERQGSELAMSAEPISTQMRRPGLRRNYQYGCPHVLYSQGDNLCNADKEAATVSATVDAIDGTVITLDDGWEGAFDPIKFVRGRLEWTPAGMTTHIRTILRVNGNDLTISGLPLDLDIGDAVDVVLGCNHRAFADDDGDCEGLHDNIVNYGGQPWIPYKNVINTNPYY